MNKERIKGVVIGFILTALLFSAVTVFASDGIRNISVTFRNIRLVVNGELITPRDGAGNIVEPFIFEGTTYLPVRAVGEAFGMPVEWDGNTSTVYVGPRGGGAVPVLPVAYSWLDHMPHLNHQNSHSRHTLTSWEAGNRSNDGTVFNRGIVFSQNHSFQLNTEQSIEIPLNALYSTFEGTLVSNSSGTNSAQIQIYGDGRLLYTSPMISAATLPIPFSIDASNVLMLRIHVGVNGQSHDSRIGIVDARFVRN
jgi:hypothetical protein